MEVRRKTCRVCGVEKSFRSFYRRPDTVDGRTSDCRDCRRAYSRENHALKRETRLPKMLALNAQPHARLARRQWEQSAAGRAYRRDAQRIRRRMAKMEAA